ncbi:MAG: hypothetical protein JWM57_1865 [Phycisphaerales bacterium]|nr:hypothetical protein [Phycisphaerales bacterium]
MNADSRAIRRAGYAALAAIGGATLAVQLFGWLSSTDGTVAGVARTLVGFLSFFTNLTNLVVFIASVRLAWRFDGWFARPRVATALAVYVTVLCAVYELMLRRLWHPQGLSLVVETILHYIVPIGWIMLWLIWIPKGSLRWRDAAPWLIAPVLYGVWIGVLGLLFGGSPYGFLNVGTLGGVRVAMHIGGLVVMFWSVGLAFVAIDATLGRRAKRI